MMCASVSDLRIVLLGKSLSENCRVGNFILGRTMFNSEAPPDHVQRERRMHKTVINVPHLLQPHLSDPQIKEVVNECMYLSNPGPHVIILVLKNDQCSEEDQEHVEKVLHSFTDMVYDYTMVLTTQEQDSKPTKVNDVIKEIINKCSNRLYQLKKNSSSAELREKIENFAQKNSRRYLVCDKFASLEGSENSMEQQVIEVGHPELPMTVALFGNSASIQFETENILLGGEKPFKTVKTSRIVPAKRKIAERYVSVINMISLHENNFVHHLIDQLLIENEIHAFIFVVLLGQLTDADKMGLEWLQSVFGDEVLQFVMILFTYEREEECDTIIDDLENKIVLEQLLEKCGGRYQTCNKMMANQSEISELMNKIEHLFKENQQQCYTADIYNTVLKRRNIVQKNKYEIEQLYEKYKPQPQAHVVKCTDKVQYKSLWIKNSREQSDQGKMKPRPELYQSNQSKRNWRMDSMILPGPERLGEECTDEASARAVSNQPVKEELDKPTIKIESPKHTTTRATNGTHKKMVSLEEAGPELNKVKEFKTTEYLFGRLNLKASHCNLKAADVLQLTERSLLSHESCAEEELIQTFIQKLLMMNYKARYICVNKASEQDQTQNRDTDISDIFKAVFLTDKGTSQSDPVHPMDVQMAVFHCADSFLKQLMVTKLSQCQYALPLLVPDPFTQKTEFPLWTFRQINKSWKMRNTNNEIISQTQPIYKAETPMVSFFRFGSVSSSKSQLMNSLINEKHNTFFHRNCPGSSRTRVLMDGVVEIAWFCPSGTYNDKFTDCVAFCNLHGDAGDHEKQLQILTEMASVNVVLLPRLDRDAKHAAKIQNLYSNRKPLICLFTEDNSVLKEIQKGKYIFGLKDRGQPAVSDELRKAINDCLSESPSTFRLEDVSKHSDIRVDEEDDDDCRRGREAAQQMMGLLVKKDLRDIKDLFLPHQGKLWRQWSQKNKELHRPRADDTEMEISKKHSAIMKIRQQQHACEISDFMKLFIKEMSSHAEHKMFFLKWLRILLDEYTSADLSALHHKYNEKWPTVLKLKEKKDESEEIKHEQTELEKISDKLQLSNFGLEHILREIGQIYESCSSVNKNKNDLQVHFSSLPSFAAEMMISGFPLELMDGDAAHVPVIWISAVLDQLIQKLGDQRVFVLSVLEIQSSGKSTMLNAMFGLQFAVSAGRCTRGAFMQLVKVSDEMKVQMNFDYILVVDTEGLCALELRRSTRHHDNELATFVVGLANLTLINIFGENPAEMQDILQIVVQAFMRMKKVKLNPSCVFVHQNVTDITAGDKAMEGRRRLQETLDEMAKLAAKDELHKAERFSDVIRFDVQNDVKYFAHIWEGNPPMAPPNPSYCENIQELKETIMSHASKSDEMMLVDLKDHVKDLWEALLNEQFVFSFRNSLEISAYRKLEIEYSKWSWSLRSAMLEIENKLHNKIENNTIDEVEEIDLQRELKTTSEEVKKSMSEFFEKETDADILIQWKTSFENKIKKVEENIARGTKRKLNEILQQRDMRKEIDAQSSIEETRPELDKEKELKTTEYLFGRLHLKASHCNLRAADVLQLTEHSLQSHESCAEEELIQTFIQKLLMMNYRARYICVNKASEQDKTQHRDTDISDIFKAVFLTDKGTSQSDPVHPMDVQMAVFHCADSFLKQLIVTKLSQCQYALPLLVPDPVTQQIEFPLWTFRQINKSWKIRNTNNEIISQTQPIYKAETPMVFFFRFGSVSSSKSQLMNSLINEKHDTFFHRNCPGSSRTRVLMDGVVEIAWFCPSGKHDDKFNDCVAFCNLHGDAGDHEKQLQILTEMSSVNVVLLPRLDRDAKHAAKIQNLYSNRKPLICLFTEDNSVLKEIQKGKYIVGLKDRCQPAVSDELRKAINDCLSESSSTFRLEDVSKHSDIKVDEEDNDDCRRGREAAQQMMGLLVKKDLRDIKDSFLPHQGKLWHQWSQKNKELHRPRADDTEMEISKKHSAIMKIRQQQHACGISDFMKLFIKEMSSHVEHKMFFLKWLRILLDEYTSADLSALHHKYNENWPTVLKLKEKQDESEEIKDLRRKELERISDELQLSNFGLEHIMREIGQIYESCSSVNKNKKDLQVHFSSLPSLAAEMMISGFPLELMDGDAAHVPVIWISAVLDQLIQKLGDQRLFVLSVLGLQSSGKSTMLNAMFGLQFAVSAGRCTRGAFMQLVKVSDEMKAQMNFDYILVVDTEGLCALELRRSTRHHDNELATFAVGIGNLTLINIFGENPAEMQDILQIVVQSFMRMKKVKLNPSCVFVHQNVTDITAGDKTMEGRRRLQETLDEMAKLAAKDEVYEAERFSDVIRFDVQNDVKYFAHIWEGNPPMAPPNPSYCENIQELKETIMSHASKSDEMMLVDLKERIKDLWEALLNERFVFSFRNSLEIAAYRKLETKYSKWSWSLRSAMLEIENRLHNKIENDTIDEVEEIDLQRELKTTSEEVKKSMSEFFEKDTDANILIQWKTSFENKIKDVEGNIVRGTKRKLNEILQQRDMKKEIDAQCTHHENTLYEKSKELALKMKYKAKDEEALQKEFDLFWEQSVKKIMRDTHSVKHIDALRDMKHLLNDIYEGCLPTDHWKEGSEYNNIFTVSSYSEYVVFKKSTKKGMTEGVNDGNRTVRETFRREDEAQIRVLIRDVVQQTDNMIQSFNISKMGYNISFIQQITDHIINKVKQHQEGPVKYVFKNQFLMDLLLSISNRANKMITDQHRMFREANDPIMYVEKKREEYYSIFQTYCRGATSAAIFGKIICQKLKDPIEQSVHKKTARDLTDEMRTNCESLNGNRSNLEKHILKTLAEEEDFDKYMSYINNPRDHFKSFIRDEVSRYITDKFSVSVLPKMKENIKLLQQKIMKAAHESTERVRMNRRDVGLWLKSFTQQLSDELIFSEKDLSGVKHDDVDNFSLLEDVIREEITVIMFDIGSRFNTETFPVNLDYKFRPDEILIDHFCQCCWVQCPFCTAVCTNTIENHDEDHSVQFHRSIGLNGIHYRNTSSLSIHICTSAVANSNLYFYTSDSDEKIPWTEYRRAGEVYAKWSITPDLSVLPYWKWFVCRFQKDLEKHYNNRFEGSGEIPYEWRAYSKQDAFESLDKYN
ncbi:uncharacterized protein [Garra rufa]|uniref:uncharacterized protein n=1 Tax=Garra rufa TaxID=137080 RepID=UPI003CCEE9C5